MLVSHFKQIRAGVGVNNPGYKWEQESKFLAVSPLLQKQGRSSLMLVERTLLSFFGDAHKKIIKQQRIQTTFPILCILNTNINIYTYVTVCVCVCVCAYSLWCMRLRACRCTPPAPTQPDLHPCSGDNHQWQSWWKHPAVIAELGSRWIWGRYIEGLTEHIWLVCKYDWLSVILPHK